MNPGVTGGQDHTFQFGSVNIGIRLLLLIITVPCVNLLKKVDQVNVFTIFTYYVYFDLPATPFSQKINIRHLLEIAPAQAVSNLFASCYSCHHIN